MAIERIPVGILSFIAVCLALTVTDTSAASFFTIPSRTSFIAGEKVFILCSGDGVLPQLSLNSSVIPADDSNSGDNAIALDIENFSAESVGTYMCSDSVSNDTLSLALQDYSLDIVGSLPEVEGDMVNISCVFSSPNRVVDNYQWTAISSSGIERNLASESSLTIPSVPVADNGGVYQCEVTLNTNVVLTTSINISIILAPVIHGSSMYNLTVFTNQPDIQLPCNITGEPLNITWTVGGSPVDPTHHTVDQTTGSLTVGGAIEFSDDGEYVCTGVNKAGSKSITYYIQVLGPPSISTADKQMFQKHEGDPLTLPCAYNSNPSPSVFLGFSRADGDSNIVILDEELTSEGFVLESVSISDNGQFYCLVNNDYGSVNISYYLKVTGVPDSPTDVRLLDIGPQSLTVSWQEVNTRYKEPEQYDIIITQDEVTVVRQYTVQAAATSNGGGGTVLQQLVDGLVPSTKYTVRLSSSNAAGSSPAIEHTITTTKTAPQFKFFNVTPVNGGRGLLMEWELLYTGGSDVNIFTIIVTAPETTPIRVDIDNQRYSNGSHQLGDLEPNIAYSVQVSLGNAIDTTLIDYSVTTARGPPVKPNKPTVSEIQMHSVQLSFDIPSIGSESVEHYLVNVSSPGKSIRQLTITSDHPNVLSALSVRNSNGGQSVVLLVTSLDDDTSYSFSVSAGGSAGNGPFSEYSDTIKTKNGMILYFIIAGVVVGSLLIVLLLVVVAIVLLLVNRRRRKRIGQKHTITNRLNEPNDFGFPNSSISENVHVVEGYSPPPSSMEIRKEDLSSPAPPPYPGHSKTNHSRTQSMSSTTSFRKPDYLRSPTDQHHPADSSDSAYGGSAEKGVNHIYHEIPPKGHSMSSGERISYSYPSINRVASYDVDKMPPRPNCATDV